MYHLGSTYYWRMYYCDVILFEWSEDREDSSIFSIDAEQSVEPDTGNIPVSTFEKTCATTEKT